MTAKSLISGMRCELKVARAVMRTADSSIAYAETETGVKLAMRSTAGCEMRMVVVVPPLT